MVSYIINSKIDIITTKPKLKLASNDVNVKVFEHFLVEVIQTLQNNLAFFLVSILKTFTSAIDNYSTLGSKTLTDLENNIKYNKQAFNNHINTLKLD